LSGTLRGMNSEPHSLLIPSAVLVSPTQPRVTYVLVPGISGILILDFAYPVSPKLTICSEFPLFITFELTPPKQRGTADKANLIHFRDGLQCHQGRTWPRNYVRQSLPCICREPIAEGEIGNQSHRFPNQMPPRRCYVCYDLDLRGGVPNTNAIIVHWVPMKKATSSLNGGCQGC
jgi:hypothetical protein